MFVPDWLHLRNSFLFLNYYFIMGIVHLDGFEPTIIHCILLFSYRALFYWFHSFFKYYFISDQFHLRISFLFLSCYENCWFQIVLNQGSFTKHYSLISSHIFDSFLCSILYFFSTYHLLKMIIHIRHVQLARFQFNISNSICIPTQIVWLFPNMRIFRSML